MHDRYEYRTIRVERASWPKVAAAVHGSVARSVQDAGGTVFGLWRGEIGWWNDEGAVVSAWPPSTEPHHALLNGIPGIVESSIERVEATVRPVDPEPPTADGVYAHRWFVVAESDWDEFLDLSQGAWPDFESAAGHEGTRVVGLFRSLDRPDHALLLTRYASLAAWEQTRPYNPNPSEGTDNARAKFLRRADLTIRTGVRLGRLVPPPA